VNDAVLPAITVLLTGWVVIAGATKEIPVPLKATEVIEPLDRINSRVPE
jgi:hypothetical protein